MYTKFMALLVAGVALSGCCVSGTGCNAPAPSAPDGHRTLLWPNL